MNNNIVNGVVEKPIGPRARRPIHSPSPCCFNYCRDDTMSKKRAADKSNQNHSLDKSAEDTSMNSKTGVKLRHGTSPNKLYPDLEESFNRHNESCDSDGSNRSNSFHSSTSTSNDAPSRDATANRSSSSLPNACPGKIKGRIHASNGCNGCQNGSESWLTLTNVGMIIITIIILITGIEIFKFVNSTDSIEQQSNNEIKNFTLEELRKDVTNLQKVFPSQEKLIWPSLVSGIMDVASNRIRPAVILLLSMNEETTYCLVKNIDEIVSRTLGGTSHALLTPEMMKNNISEVFSLVKKQFSKTKTVVFSDILNMRPESLKALHYICDPDESLITNAVYLIIMKSELYKETKKPTAFAEMQLRNSFSSTLDEEILDPLITRVTAGAVLLIKPENSTLC